MKKLLFAISFLLFLPAAVGRVYAGEVAGSAAQLANTDVAVDTRIERLRTFLASYDSPLQGEAKTFVEKADKYNLDWKLVPAIAGAESTFGKAIPAGSFNAWGWGIFTGAQDGVHFTSWADGIEQVCRGLREQYFNRGAKDLYDVGWMYAANGDSWTPHVQYFIDKLDTFVVTDVNHLPVSI